MSQSLVWFCLQLSTAGLGAGPPEQEDQAHRVSDGHPEEGCEVHRGATYRGMSSPSRAAVGWRINAAAGFLPAQISEDDQFIFCGTTSGDVMKFNLKTRLLSDYGPKRFSAKHSRVGPPRQAQFCPLGGFLFNLNVMVLFWSERQRVEDSERRAPACWFRVRQIDAVLCDGLPGSKVGSDTAS